MVTQPAYYGTNVYYGSQHVLVRYVNAKPMDKEFNDNVDLIKYEDEERVKIIDHVFEDTDEKDTVHITVPVSKIKELQAVLSPALILHHINADNKAAYETNLDISEYGVMATCYTNKGSAFRGYVPLQGKRNDTTEEKNPSIVLNAKYLTDLLTMIAKESYDTIELCIAPYDENHSYRYADGHCIVPMLIKAGQIEAVITAMRVYDNFNKYLDSVHNILK